MNLRAALLVVMALAMNLFASDVYFPPSESAGGWRWCKDKDQVRSLAGMDPERLSVIRDAQLQIYQGPWAIVIIRKGYVAAEWFGVPAMPNTTFDGWSSTKSAIGIAFGLLMDGYRSAPRANRRGMSEWQETAK
jgi:CubicO group peptidase (beta-lactamase class C family)